MNIGRTFSTVFAIAWVAGLGFWFATGRSDWHVIGLAMVANLPIVMCSYYYGHKHGQEVGWDQRQAEVREAIAKIPRTPRLP